MRNPPKRWRKTLSHDLTTIVDAEGVRIAPLSAGKCSEIGDGPVLPEDGPRTGIAERWSWWASPPPHDLTAVVDAEGPAVICSARECSEVGNRHLRRSRACGLLVHDRDSITFGRGLGQPEGCDNDGQND